MLPVQLNQCIVAKRQEVNIPNNPHFAFVLNVMMDEGYIRYALTNTKEFKVYPKYSNDTKPILHGFKLVSKPSNRIYVNLEQLKNMIAHRRPRHIQYIISTRKGFMTAREAYKCRLGGELMYTF